MKREKVVFVRGGQVGEDRPWRMFHFDPRRERETSRQYDLVYFDMPEGKRKTWDMWQPTRGWPSKRKPTHEVDLKRVKLLEPRLDGTGFEETGPEKPTILNLYDWVKDQEPNSIGALHFFTHGDYSEPIIWEHCAEGGKPPQRPLAEPRHRNDTEPRRRDFFGPNPLAGNDGMQFWAAFSSDAFVKMWGCDAAKENRRMVLKQAKEPTQTRREDILDSIEETYAMLLATLLGVTVWAPPIGWGTRADPQLLHPELKYRGVWPPDWKTELWWRVEQFPDAAQQVFRDFGAKLDSTRYVGYHPRWLASARPPPVPPPLKVTSPKELQQQLGQP